MTWREKILSDQQQRKQNQLWRTRLELQSAQGAEVVVDGKCFVNFCSNDYLGLANHPRLIEASQSAVIEFGTGSGASHLVCGHHELHHNLEVSIADFVGAQRALVFSTGYMANLAIPQTFLNHGDRLFQDRLNHASLIDAGRNCAARMTRYQHADVDSLLKKIKSNDRHQTKLPEVVSRIMIMTDGVFSMDGDQAPVAELKRIADSHDGILVIDEAHGFGTVGPKGIGSIEAQGLSPSGNLLMVGTLGKAAGSFGAFVAGDSVLIEHLIQHGRTYTYTTALPPSVIAATIAAIELIRDGDELRADLQQNIQHFKSLCHSRLPAGIAAGMMPSETAIQPLVIGDSDRALDASSLLRQQGFLVSAIRQPTVPTNSARLRITLTAAHTNDQIERLVDALATDQMLKLFHRDQACELLP